MGSQGENCLGKGLVFHAQIDDLRLKRCIPEENATNNISGRSRRGKSHSSSCKKWAFIFSAPYATFWVGALWVFGGGLRFEGHSIQIGKGGQMNFRRI
jgi:hypothetical protein